MAVPKKNSVKKCYAYMCTTDFMCELKQNVGMSEFFKSPKDLKKDRSCWKECGITKVEISFVKKISTGTL